MNFDSEYNAGLYHLVSLYNDGDLSYSNLQSTNIVNAMVNTERFVLLYIYNPDKEKASAEFLKIYGAGLNNRLKAEIPMFTVYPVKTYGVWRDSLPDAVKETLGKQFHGSHFDEAKQIELLQRVAEGYGVKDSELPALIVIDVKGGNSSNGYPEKFTYASMNGYNQPEMINQKVSKILDAIEATPNDFDAIKQACGGRTGYGVATLGSIYSNAAPESVSDIVCSAIRNCKTTQRDCADEIGVHRNTFTRYLNGEARFSLDRIFRLAAFLRLGSETLDSLILQCAIETPTQIRDKLRNGRAYQEIRTLLSNWRYSTFAEIEDCLDDKDIDWDENKCEWVDKTKP